MPAYIRKSPTIQKKKKLAGKQDFSFILIQDMLHSIIRGSLENTFTIRFSFLLWIVFLYSWDSGYGPAGYDGYPVWSCNEERDVQNGFPALQGTAVQAYGYSQVNYNSHPPPLLVNILNSEKMVLTLKEGCVPVELKFYSFYLCFF